MQKNFEKIKESISKEDIYFTTKRGIVVNADCLKTLREIPDKTVNLIVTSPPYNVGKDYDTYKDKKPYNEYLFFLKEVFRECYRVLADDGRMVINHYFSCGDREFRFSPLMDINTLCMDIGFKHHGIGFWTDPTITKLTAWGSWLSASSPYINSPYEGFLILYKNEWKRKRKGITKITKKEFMKLSSGIWNFQPEKNRLHPAPFPASLISMIVRGLSFEEDVVLDPFAGSGTVGYVCEMNNRYWVNIEISRKYCKIIKHRTNILF